MIKQTITLSTVDVDGELMEIMEELFVVSVGAPCGDQPDNGALDGSC